jgi:hypothetical protein
MSGEMPDATIFIQVLKAGEARAKQQHSRVAAGDHSTVMSRPHHRPGLWLARDRMVPRDLLTILQIIHPRLGQDLVANNNRPVQVIGISSPQLVTGVSGKNDNPPTLELTRHELVPIMAIGISSTKNQFSIGEHHGQFAAADADFTTVGDVHRGGPELLTATSIEGHGHSQVGILEAIFRNLPLFFRESLEM